MTESKGANVFIIFKFKSNIVIHKKGNAEEKTMSEGRGEQAREIRQKKE